MAERRQVLIDLITRTSGSKAGITGLQRNLGGLNKGTVRANKSLGGLGKNTASAKRGLGSLVGGAGGAGLAMTGVGAAVLATGAIIKGSVGAFASFDDKMNSSIAIMGNVSDAMRKDMSDAAREMATTTRFSADEAAESYFFLASAGLDAEQSIAALPVVAAFGQAGMFDMALATDLLTDAQSSLGLTTDDAAENLKNMTRVSDVFVKANTLANTSVQQVSEAITNKLGGAMRAANIEIEEGVAVLAAYADQGLKGASAGEAFGIVLRDLKKVNRESADVLAAHNIQIVDAEGNFRAMADIIEDLENAFEGLSVAEAAELANALGFQDRSFKNIQLLLGQSEAIREYTGELKTAGGVTEEVAGKQLESFSAQMGLLKSQVIDAGISLGEQLAPVILDVGKGLVTFITGITPVIVGLVKLQKVLFKFTPLGVTFKAFGKALEGIAVITNFFDPAAASASRLALSIEEIETAVEGGAQPAAAYANSLLFMAEKGELTDEVLVKLASGVEFVGEELALAQKEVLDYARANGFAADQIQILESAILAEIIASDRSSSEKRILAFELGLVEQGASDLELAELGLIDSTGVLTDAEGELEDATGDAADEVLSLAEALAAAEAAQTSLSDVLRAAADPLFAAASAMKGLIEAEKNLIEVQEDHHASASELADAELEVLEATLTAQGALDGLDAAGLEDQILIVQDVLGKSREEAILFLESLGLLDGTQIGVNVNTVFTASGSGAAAAAASQGTSAFQAITGGRPSQHGGRRRKGESLLVGEAGPELFVPNQNGMIISNDQLNNTTNNKQSVVINFINPNLANDPVKAIRSRFAMDALAGAA